MRYDMADIPFATRYKIMNSTITPRPIAWTVTLDEAGVPNCAPHSFFNAMGSDPAMIIIGLIKVRSEDKDTAAHIRTRGDFSVSLVSEDDGEAMNMTAADAPRGVDELALAGIATMAASRIAVPLIASAPVSFECRAVDLLDYPGQTLVVAEVLVTHIADAFISDMARTHIDTPAMRLIARTHGAGWYQRGTDQFQMERPSYDALVAAKGVE